MKPSHRIRPATLGAVLGAGLLGLLLGGMAPAAPAGGGCGHDPRLDDADACLEKAWVLISAAQNEGVVPPFGGHDKKAQRAISLARKEVGKAIAYAEASCD